MKMEKIVRLGGGRGYTTYLRVTASGITKLFRYVPPTGFDITTRPTRRQVFTEIREWLARDPKEVVCVGHHWDSGCNRLYPIYEHLDGTPLTDDELEDVPYPSYRW